jgi:hypothetical protein
MIMGHIEQRQMVRKAPTEGANETSAGSQQPAASSSSSSSSQQPASNMAATRQRHGQTRHAQHKSSL